ncbi:DUF4372 domain-containing protein [Polaromonas sp. P1(28)-8]|nr:DUF4372 domain-containing protein [Polaromonas sp. P1(28)-8]
MHKGKLVFAQLKEHLPRSVFDRCVSRYAGSHAPLTFSHWDQLLCMVFAQLTSREGLRDITTCLRSQSTKLYHAGPRCQNSCRLRFFAGYPHRSDISCTENLIHITPPNSKNRRCSKPGIAARVQFKALPPS